MIKLVDLRIPVSVLLGAALLVACSGPGETAAPTCVPTLTIKVDDAFEQNRRLGRGMCLANALEAPQEGDWGIVLQEEYFDLIKEAGFSHVRIPIRWSAHADTEAPYTIDPEFFARVDWAVEQALCRGLLVMIDVHHYEELVASPYEHRQRFLGLWSQIAEHYQDYSNDLLFEILNEPYDQLTAYRWNQLLADALEVIRETNPDRFVVVGPPLWNIVWELDKLRLPEDDRRIIATVHYYTPMELTHQGTDWVEDSDEWLGTTWEGTDAQKRRIRMDLNRPAVWSEVQGRPVHLGEFGTYYKADMASRVLWTAFIVQQAEERGMSWSYWEFGAGFGVYDLSQGEWNEELLDALMPQEQ
jgi:endoglucanase